MVASQISINPGIGSCYWNKNREMSGKPISRSLILPNDWAQDFDKGYRIFTTAR